MELSTRKVLDKAFSGTGFFSLFLMCAALVILLTPIFMKGSKAFFFKETVEGRQYKMESFNRGNPDKLRQELARAEKAREPVYEMLEKYSKEIGWTDMKKRKALNSIKDKVRKLLGPLPGEKTRALPREQYGQTRWDRAQAHLHKLLYKEEYVFENPGELGKKVYKPRKDEFEGSTLEPLFTYFEEHLDEMLLPRRKFYWRFLFDRPEDAYFFGGIWPSFLGTLYLTIGTMIVAAPIGIISAIYLTQYAGENLFVSFLRSCISTLAGVPSVVFGLFGLAFFINTLPVFDGKSVAVGCFTLALLVLPTVIRASEEAILAVPRAYKEASLGLGATQWHTISRVILPAALPGIITSIIISMGRAAGETAPILFTAAVTQGGALSFGEIFSQASPALPASIYSIVTVHRQVEEVRHVQYGMVMSLVSLVLILNVVAIIMRAKISYKLRG